MKKKTYVSPLCKTYPLVENIEFLALTGGEKPKPKPVKPSNPVLRIDTTKTINSSNGIL
jgi:hypothetical protein